MVYAPDGHEHVMKNPSVSRISSALVLKQAGLRTALEEFCRVIGIREVVFCMWKHHHSWSTVDSKAIAPGSEALLA